MQLRRQLSNIVTRRAPLLPRARGARAPSPSTGKGRGSRSLLVHMSGRLRFADGRLERHRAALLEGEGEREVLTRFERLLQIEQHHMEAARLESDRLARLERERAGRTHAHDAVRHLVAMEL